jgi:hypothetical protein
MNVAALTPDVVATGNVVTLKVSAGFLEPEDHSAGALRLENFEANGDYVRFVGPSGSDLTAWATTDSRFVPKPDKITILRTCAPGTPQHNKLSQRLVPYSPADASLCQTLEVTVFIGSEVPAGLYGLDVKLGRVHAYTDELSQDNRGNSGTHKMKDVLRLIKLRWQDKDRQATQLGRSSRPATSQDPTQIIRPFYLAVEGMDDGETVTVSLEQNGRVVADAEYKVSANKIHLPSGLEAKFLFVEDYYPGICTGTVQGVGDVVRVSGAQGACLVAQPKEYAEFTARLWPYDPHDPGDYSVDVADASGDNAANWEKTRYFYTVEPNPMVFPTAPSIPDAGFHSDTINYLNAIHWAENPGIGSENTGTCAVTFKVDRFIPTGRPEPWAGTGTPDPSSVGNGVISETLRVRLVASCPDNGSPAGCVLTCSLNGTSAPSFQLPSGRPALFVLDVPI